MAKRSNVRRSRRRPATLQWRPTWGSKELAARTKEDTKILHADWMSTMEQLPKADKTRSFETTRPKDAAEEPKVSFNDVLGVTPGAFKPKDRDPRDRVLKNEGTKAHHSLSVTQGRSKDSPSEIQHIVPPVQIVQLSLRKP